MLRVILFTVALAAPLALVEAQQEPPRKRILMVYGHDPNAPGVIAFSNPLKAALRAQFPAGVEFYDENLDLDRFPDPDRSAELARYFAEKYEGFKLDAIVTEGAQALRFARDRLAQLLPAVPVVYGLSFEPVVDYNALPPNFTGRSLPLPFAPTYELARALHPDAERFVLVGGSSVMDSLLFAEAQRIIAPLLRGAELAVLRDWSYGELIDRLRRLPPRSVVIFSSFTRDRRGREFNSGDLIASLTRVSTAPAYGIARNWVGDGLVGGGVMDFANDGTRVGSILVRVLSRGPNEPMPRAELSTTSLVVDWRQLQRWDVPEDRVPPNAAVLFRAPSLWERYGDVILGVLAVITVESLLIALLLLERRRRLRAQRAIEAQVDYERMMGALTADTVRRSPAEILGVLEDMLPRVGQLTGACSAVLVVEPDDGHALSARVTWTQPGSSAPAGGGDRLEIPLVVDKVKYGVLELYQAPGVPWPAELATRLGPVGDLIAGALARARAGRVLEQTRGQVEHMARVATVSGLAAAVSHELRQPLTAIRINAAAGALFLARSPQDLDEVRAALQEIIQDVQRATDVMEHLRSLLRKQEPVSTTIDLNGVCRQTAKLVEHEVSDRRARLSLRLDPNVPAVRGDPVQLQQAVINLTLNALDALSPKTLHRDIVISTTVHNGDAEVHVADTGPGLSPDALQRLFEPFFSTKPHGLGLGLTIVRSIVERHGGILRGDNRKGGGAVFTMTLPPLPATPARTRIVSHSNAL